MKIIKIVGARPNFPKMAPLIEEAKKYPLVESLLVHTGQHYNEAMSQSFFDDFQLPKPDIHLGVGSDTHAVQTANVMIAFEKICLEHRPDLVIVVGDVNSTVACALVAAKMQIKVAHVEAGLRSYDRTMPEEINRLITDQLSDYLFTHSMEANDNLRREGLDANKIHFVGNIMIDTLLKHLATARQSNILQRLQLEEKKFSLLTLHRPSNVDNLDALRGILLAVRDLAERIKIVFPMHPRTSQKIDKFGLGDFIKHRNIVNTEPLGYFEFLCLMANAKLVLTDSGGIQEETTILGIPCLTLRNNTERPITVEMGTNQVIGNQPEKIIQSANQIFDLSKYEPKRPALWDGRTAERIYKILLKK